MDREEILNTLGEVRYELAKVKEKLDNLVAQSIRYKEIHPELDRPVRALQGTTDEIYETIEIEKWVLMNSLN
jgi:predicted nuclease with TOPRIM domain